MDKLRVFSIVFLSILAINLNRNLVQSASVEYHEWKFTNCSFDNIDACARIVLLYGARELVFPDNAKDMVPHCREEKSAVKCVSDWGRKCLKGFARQLVGLLLNGAKKNIRERCSKDGTKWYLQNSKCAIDSADSLHDCMDVLKNEVNSIRRNPVQADWLPSSCCFLDKFKTCFDKAVVPFCDKEGKRFLNWCRDSYIADLVDMGCNKDLDFGGSRCNKLMDLIGPATGLEDEPKSVFKPLYRLFLEYQEFDKLGAQFN